MIQLVIFDMAGTSIDEDNLVYKTIHQTLVDQGVEVTFEQVLALGAGKEKWQAIYDILWAEEKAEPSRDQVDQLYQRFQLSLSEAYATAPMQVFPSVRKVMEALRHKKIKIAFNTGYSREIAELILSRVGIEIGRDIDLLITADDVDRGRPHSDMIDVVCEQLQVDQKACIKIGDSAIDIEEGKNAQCKWNIGVTTGAHNRAQLSAAEPDYIFDDMSELLTLL